MGVRIFWEIWAKQAFLLTTERSSKTEEVGIPFFYLFSQKDSLGFIMVCHKEGKLGTKVVILALRMVALYMRFNGTGFWGGETL